MMRRRRISWRTISWRVWTMVLTVSLSMSMSWAREGTVCYTVIVGAGGGGISGGPEVAQDRLIWLVGGKTWLACRAVPPGSRTTPPEGRMTWPVGGTTRQAAEPVGPRAG